MFSMKNTKLYSFENQSHYLRNFRILKSLITGELEAMLIILVFSISGLGDKDNMSVDMLETSERLRFASVL